MTRTPRKNRSYGATIIEDEVSTMHKLKITGGSGAFRPNPKLKEAKGKDVDPTKPRVLKAPKLKKK